MLGWVFSCFRYPPNSDMDYRIFNWEFRLFHAIAVSCLIVWNACTCFDRWAADDATARQRRKLCCRSWDPDPMPPALGQGSSVWMSTGRFCDLPPGATSRSFRRSTCPATATLLCKPCRYYNSVLKQQQNNWGGGGRGAGGRAVHLINPAWEIRVTLKD